MQDARAVHHTAPPASGRSAGAEAEAIMLSPRLHNFLDQQHSSYTTLTHSRTVTADETAHATHLSRQLFAKTVMLKVDGTLAMMVMPAAYLMEMVLMSLAPGGYVSGLLK